MDYLNTTSVVPEDTDPSTSHAKPKYFKIAITMCVLGAIGVLSNAALIVVILINRKMRNSAIILIVNTSVWEIVMLSIFVPFNVSYLLTSCFLFGEFLCKVLNGVALFSSAVLIYTFVALSFDRYIAVAYPLEPNKAWTATRTILTLMIINLAGVILSIPKVVSARVVYFNSNTCPMCLHLNHGTIAAKVYVVLMFMFSYVVPLLFTAFNYGRIARVLFKSVDTNKRHGVDHHANSRIRLARILLVMVVVYAALLLPRHIFLIGYQFMYHDVYRLNQFALRIYGFATVCFLCSSFVNPGVLFFITGYSRNCCKAVKQQSATVLVKYRKSNIRNGTKSTSSSSSARASL
ncbi:neuromedin-B receptor-like [Anneissia japonica]|uniref:neuromedin-B receptor-like n=1 Tax=Anneissia japonica TaxID=1529436 RepID=UPI001425783E|nr:neuromedin-B receptor-like [Anneissia japonica]XP_033121295.1 neuromedin-B receptor-like [Anneissia japonica]